MTNFDRRTIIKSAGASVLAMTLAGCSGSSGSDSGSSDEEIGNGDQFVDEEPDYGDWFDDVGNYKGTLDMTETDELQVAVGAGDQGFLFDPPAVAVSAGTDVVFKWTGKGGPHNVKDENGAFDSGLKSEKGFVFTYTFEESGTYQYICSPHLSLGMKGAVVVE